MNIIMWNADIIRFVQSISKDISYVKSILGDEKQETQGDIVI